MWRRFAHQAIGQAGAFHALERGVGPRGVFRVSDAGIVFVEERVGVDVYHARGVKRVLQTVSIIALTAFFLALFLRNSDLRQVGRIMASADMAWIAAGFGVNVCALVFRAVRWR